VTTQAFKKRRQRGHPPRPLASVGRAVRFDVATVQTSARLAMFATELEGPCR